MHKVNVLTGIGIMDDPSGFPAPHRCPYCGKRWKRARVRRWSTELESYVETDEYLPRSAGHARRKKHIDQCGSVWSTIQSSILDWCSIRNND